jgi:hypothetical protein
LEGENEMLFTCSACPAQHLRLDPQVMRFDPGQKTRYFSVSALRIGIECPITFSIIATASADDRFGIRESDARSAAGSTGESNPRLGDEILELRTLTVVWIGTGGRSGGHEMDRAKLIATTITP